MATHTYLDINIVNNKLNVDDVAPIPVQFNTRRDQDYLKNPDDYFVSVVRWSIDCRLPVIVPQILLGSTMQNDALGDFFPTVYIITLYDNTTGKTGIARINFRTQSSFPVPFTNITDLSSLYDYPYFWIDSVQYFTSLVNKGFSDAYADLVLNGGNPNIPQPFFQNNADGTFTLYAPQEYYWNPTNTADIPNNQIGFNSALYTLFNGLNSRVNGWVNSPQTPIGATNYLLLFQSQLTTTFNNIQYIYSITEYPVVEYWSPLSSIVFTTLSIPVEPTNSNPTSVIGAPTTNLGQVNNNINLDNIITDFNIELINGLETRTITYYYTQGEYRFFDLNSNTSLADININACWRDKITGKLHTMYLFTGGGASLKLLFRKKNFYSGNDYYKDFKY